MYSVRVKSSRNAPNGKTQQTLSPPHPHHPNAFELSTLRKLIFAAKTLTVHHPADTRPLTAYHTKEQKKGNMENGGVDHGTYTSL
jgi:hypothetical protein